MFNSLTFLSFLVISYQGIAAIPFPRNASPANLAIARSINITGFPNIVAADRARAKILREMGLASGAHGGPDLHARLVSSIPATNAAVVYSANVGIGEPATEYSLLIDTGSSNTWIGAGKQYVQTPTSQSTSDEVVVAYGSGFFEGHEYVDKVTLGPDLVIPQQSIGVAKVSHGLEGFDGILGLGPVGLTAGTLIPSRDEIPTVVDNLVSLGIIDEAVLGVSFEPTTTLSETNGELTFGGTDPSKYTGLINYTPITTTSPASAYWGIDQSISYGQKTILSSTTGIADTGTTLILLATDAYNAYVSATGAQPDVATGLLKITAAQYAGLEDLVFNIGGVDYALTPNAQIWPRALNTDIGGKPDEIYLIVADIGAMGGQGLDFINGYTFHERFYSVYDTKNHQLGFATTPFTDAETN